MRPGRQTDRQVSPPSHLLCRPRWEPQRKTRLSVTQNQKLPRWEGGAPGGQASFWARPSAHAQHPRGGLQGQQAPGLVSPASSWLQDRPRHLGDWWGHRDPSLSLSSQCGWQVIRLRPGTPVPPGTQPRHCSPANEAVTLLRSNQPPSVEGRRWVTPRSHPRAAGSPFPISQMERLRLRGAVGAQGRADCGGSPGAPPCPQTRGSQTYAGAGGQLGGEPGVFSSTSLVSPHPLAQRA